MNRVVEAPSDIVIGAPLNRQRVRSTDKAMLVRCSSNHCEWEGLFPSAELAMDAVNTHIYRGRLRQEVGHVGNCGADLHELDGHRARWYKDTNHVYIGQIQPAELLAFDEDGLGPWYPRSTDDVNALVKRGDRIRLSGGREGKVELVKPTRSGGIATWSVAFVDPDVDLGDDSHQRKYQNELIARDGSVYCRYGEQPLAAPGFEVLGETDHQADFTEFGGGASA